MNPHLRGRVAASILLVSLAACAVIVTAQTGSRDSGQIGARPTTGISTMRDSATGDAATRAQTPPGATGAVLPPRIAETVRHLSAEPVTEVHAWSEHRGTTYWSAQLGRDGVLLAQQLADGTVSVGTADALGFRAQGTGTTTTSAGTTAQTAYLLPPGVHLVAGQPGLSEQDGLVFDDRSPGTTQRILTVDSRSAAARSAPGQLVAPLTSVASLR